MASEDYGIGAEVFLSYGNDKSLSNYLLDYGFLPDHGDRHTTVVYVVDERLRNIVKPALVHNCRVGIVGSDGKPQCCSPSPRHSPRGNAYHRTLTEPTSPIQTVDRPSPSSYVPPCRHMFPHAVMPDGLYPSHQPLA